MWAPDLDRLELRLKPLQGDDWHTYAMQPAGDGFFELTVESAEPGDLYRYRLPDGLEVPDPASRCQPEDVHGPSQVVDPHRFEWTDGSWSGRPWHETVLYELHVGAFTDAGTFEGVQSRLDHLAGLGVTAIELMPLADFPGARNWGYDGVLPFAPDSAYGSPDDLKRLVDAAHHRGLMVFVDVVYNHFGPEGNYLHRYASPFFTSAHRTPWGDAINFDRPGSRQVRDFFIDNALYWIEEMHVDGLRLDAVHAIRDGSDPSFLDELALTVAEHVRDRPNPNVHLVLENYANESGWLERAPDGGPRRFAAQWNDDVHHALHCLLTGESGGYYADFADTPARHLARGLAEGFAYQGERSLYSQAPRGTSSGHLPPAAFTNFLQNHDQIGNRAFGERLTELADERALRAAVAVLLLAPSPPLLFMGEELGCRQPFPFFCDFGEDLARAVSEGRRREFERFEAFRDPEVRARIPDPNARATYETAVIDWTVSQRPDHQRWLELYRRLLTLRHEEIVPRLVGCPGASARWRLFADSGLAVTWKMGDGSRLRLLANLGRSPVEAPAAGGRCLLAMDEGDAAGSNEGASTLRPYSVRWLLDDRPAATP
jgi:malto-oligosyltrehalose trehalohydrolase